MVHILECKSLAGLQRLREPPVAHEVAAQAGIPAETVDDSVGNSCLSGDYMGLWSFGHELQIGERIIFEDMIHYTMVKTNMFNGIHHPAIAMWTKEGKAEIFRKFSYEDYRNRMS